MLSRRICAVCKCTLDSERMTDVFVRHCNLLAKKGYFPKRWLNVLDSTLSKGKGFVLGKLRVMTLIEADWQHLMRTCLGDSEEEIIETDNRL